MTSLAEVATKLLAAPLDKTKATPVLARKPQAVQAVDDAIQAHKDAAKLARAKKIVAQTQSTTVHVEKRAVQLNPSLTDPTLEKQLRRVATKGVVQLFNAVRSAQRAADAEPQKAKKRARATAAEPPPAASSAPLDLSKESFFDILRRGSTDAAKPGGAPFLRDDFLPSKSRAKDWGRKVDDGVDGDDASSGAEEELDEDEDDEDLGEI